MLKKLDRRERIHSFSYDDAQGITYAHDDLWFLSAAPKGGDCKVFLMRIQGDDPFDPEVKEVASRLISDVMSPAGLHSSGRFDHIGDIAYAHIGDFANTKGVLFVPVTRKKGVGGAGGGGGGGQGGPATDKYLLSIGTTTGSRGHLLLGLSDDLSLVGYSWLKPDTDPSFCMVHPGNRLLYLPGPKGGNRLHAYDVSGFYDLLPDGRAWRNEVSISRLNDRDWRLFLEDMAEAKLDGTQGACLGSDDRLYVARYRKKPTYWDNCVEVYNWLTAMREDRHRIDFPPDYDEIEGLSIHPSGVLYIAVCDNDLTGTDEFEIYALGDRGRSVGSGGRRQRTHSPSEAKRRK